MRSKRMALLLGLAVTVGLLILPVPNAWAQSDCKAFWAIAQASCPTQVPLKEGDCWGGPTYAILDSKELLVGLFSGQDGAELFHGMGVVMKGGTYTFAFGPTDNPMKDSFTTSVTNAVGTLVPGMPGFLVGRYQGNQKIVQGTGRFANASGKILVEGSFLAAPLDATGNNWILRWNAEITGSICNVAPAAP